MRPDRNDIEQDFDIAFWGYDRRQVQRCLDTLTAQLTEAVSQLDSVEALQEQLVQANLEIAQLRRDAELQPPWTDRLSGIMAAAEQLWSRAARDAGTGRDPAAQPDVQLDASVDVGVSGGPLR